MKNILYTLLIASAPIAAMQHKWRKPKGSFVKAQKHYKLQQQKISAKEITLLKKMATPRLQQLPAGEELYAVTSALLLRQITLHRTLRK